MHNLVGNRFVFLEDNGKTHNRDNMMCWFSVPVFIFHIGDQYHTYLRARRQFRSINVLVYVLTNNHKSIQIFVYHLKVITNNFLKLFQVKKPLKATRCQD